MISAVPEATPGSTNTKRVSIPSRSRLETTWAPYASSPTQLTNTTRPPALAAPTAWLAPLPPKVWANTASVTVSPSFGRRAIFMIRSTFELPTTTTVPLMGPPWRARSHQTRRDDQRQPADEEHEHRRDQAARARGRARELLPDEDAPGRGDHGRTLAQAVGDREAGLLGGDQAHGHPDAPDEAAEHADEVQPGRSPAGVLAVAGRAAAYRPVHEEAVPAEVRDQDRRGEDEHRGG